jgi:hypothetical protein
MDVNGMDVWDSNRTRINHTSQSRRYNQKIGGKEMKIYVNVLGERVEAIQFKGNFDEIERFVGGDAEFRNGKLLVATRQGPLYANNLDFIVKDKYGMFSSCDSFHFYTTHLTSYTR